MLHTEPFMVWFVQVFIKEWKMQPPVDPIDAVVGEKKVPVSAKTKLRLGEDCLCNENSQRHGRDEIPIAVCIQTIIHL